MPAFSQTSASSRRPQWLPGLTRPAAVGCRWWAQRQTDKRVSTKKNEGTVLWKYSSRHAGYWLLLSQQHACCFGRAGAMHAWLIHQEDICLPVALWRVFLPTQFSFCFKVFIEHGGSMMVGTLFGQFLSGNPTLKKNKFLTLSTDHPPCQLCWDFCDPAGICKTPICCMAQRLLPQPEFGHKCLPKP